ncbi:hypothetical protein ACQCN2_19190 [Brevibacillus ginsengisoli]|uniref:hypothetical protein n=1 Tax=Brevibacillus ginsengisoli TaxID=363854 RepID=UPI003CEEC37E
MKAFLKFTLMIVILFSFTGSAFARNPLPPGIVITFKTLSSKCNLGDTVNLELETTSEEPIQSVDVNVVLPDGSTKSLSTKTTNPIKYTYTTTGTYKPGVAGTHTIQVTVTSKDKNGEIITGENSKSFTVNNPDAFSIVSITPKNATISLGQEIPLLITYKSKTSVQFTFSQKVEEVKTYKDGGVYKKLIILKPTKIGENPVIITGKNKYNADIRPLIINVEE